MDLMQAFNNDIRFIPKPDRTFNLGKNHSPYTETGVAIIVGTHPQWEQDFIQALSTYPDAVIYAVNEAVKLVHAKYLVTAHAESLDKFIDAHKQTWGDDIICHVSDSEKTHIDASVWPSMVGGGSAPLAAAIALHMGCEMAILCGCPLNGGDGYAIKTDDGNFYNPRMGKVKQGHSLINCWHRQLKELKNKEPEFASRIRSMSGFTKDLFGGIDVQFD